MATRRNATPIRTAPPVIRKGWASPEWTKPVPGAVLLEFRRLALAIGLDRAEAELRQLKHSHIF